MNLTEDSLSRVSRFAGSLGWRHGLVFSIVR